MVINEDFSFDFYTIEDRDTIVALPESSDPVRQFGRWAQSSRDSEAFNSLVNSIMNLTTRRESMRLRDLAVIKKELARKGRFLNKVPRERPILSVVRPCATVATARADQVSTQPLPVLW
jgi:hypothetical protein